MQYRRLGGSDLEVSAVGIGTMSWPFCDFGQRLPPGAAVDRAAIDAILGRAIEHGINLVDTAEGYGLGFAEALLGESLHATGRRGRMLICTKVGRFPSDGGTDCDLRATHVIARCEESLRRLRTDRIDLYLAHRPDPRTPIAETMAAMATLRQQGKIRHFGVSEFDAGQLEGALAHGPVVANQLAYNLVERRIDRGLRAYCRQREVGIMVYSPMAKGLLSGKYDLERLPGPDDYRHGRFHFSPATLPAFMRVAGRCREVARQAGMPPSALALAWCLAQPGIATVLPGAKRPEQIAEAAAAADLVVPPAVLRALDEAAAECT